MTLDVKFYDQSNVQIGVTQQFTYLRGGGDGQLEWHGWETATPFLNVQITGSSAIALDAFQLSAPAPVPEPAQTALATGAALAAFGLWRRSRNR